MAIPKKNSRIITIDDIKYRWVVGPNDGYNIFVAQREGVEGRKITVYFQTDINSYWVEFPHVQNLNLKVLQVKDAATIIRQALQLGWNPEEKGPPLVFDLVDSKIIKRKPKAGK